VKTSPAHPHKDDTLLKETAVAIGEAAGTVAALAKSVFTHPAAPAKSAAKKVAGKLAPKNKARIPRKQKKSLAKKAA
jgi:hypothetical protein